MITCVACVENTGSVAKPSVNVVLNSVVVVVVVAAVRNFLCNLLGLSLFGEISDCDIMSWLFSMSPSIDKGIAKTE